MYNFKTIEIGVDVEEISKEGLTTHREFINILLVKHEEKQYVSVDTFTAALFPEKVFEDSFFIPGSDIPLEYQKIIPEHLFFEKAA